MARERPEPKPEGAPAYMAQFTALMTILLAFFITMLTLGQARTSQYKSSGFGYIKNAFGTGGGVGLLPFWRSMMKKYPKINKNTQDSKDARFLGYMKGSFQSDRFDADGIGGTEVEKRGYSIRITSDVMFDPGRLVLTSDARAFLDRMAGVFANLPNHVLTACCYSSTGDSKKDHTLAAERAAVIARYLEEQGRIPRHRIRSVGYAHERYIGPHRNKKAQQATVFLVRKVSERRRI